MTFRQTTIGNTHSFMLAWLPWSAMVSMASMNVPICHKKHQP